MLDTAAFGAAMGSLGCARIGHTSYCCLGTNSRSIEILERDQAVEAMTGPLVPT